MKAHDILAAAQKHMQDRAATYDKPEGERSIGATVEAFRAVTGDGLMNTEERGWLFMELLKAVRSQQGDYRADNYEDGAAYVALAGEAAARDRKKPVIRELYQEKARAKVVLDGHEVDTDFDSEKERMPAIGTNGNDGGHYASTLPIGYSWADAPPDATVLVVANMTGIHHWADAFCDGARIYGAQFERMGLTSSSGWKLVARRPGSDLGWVVGTGTKPDMPDTMNVEVKFRDGECRIDPVGSWIWEHQGSIDDILQYRVVEALEQ